MIEGQPVPDPGPPRADGAYLQHARATLQAQGIRTPEQFAERYGVELFDLTAFGLLWTVDRTCAEREMYLNALYRAGLRRNRTAAHDGGTLACALPRPLPTRTREAEVF